MATMKTTTPAARTGAPAGPIALALALLLALPACASPQPPSPAAAAAPTPGIAAPGPTPATRKSKPGAMVQIAARAPAAPLPQGPAVVRLELHGAPGVQEVSLRYQAEGALRVEGAAPARAQLDAQRQASVEVPVTVLAPGLHYLHVFAEAQGRSTAVSVRLDAGGTAQQRQKRRAAREEGGFVVLPAQETRRD